MPALHGLNHHVLHRRLAVPPLAVEGNDCALIAFQGGQSVRELRREVRSPEQITGTGRDWSFGAGTAAGGWSPWELALLLCRRSRRSLSPRIAVGWPISSSGDTNRAIRMPARVRGSDVSDSPRGLPASAFDAETGVCLRRGCGRSSGA